MRKCPPGVLCIEWYMSIFILLALMWIGYQWSSHFVQRSFSSSEQAREVAVIPVNISTNIGAVPFAPYSTIGILSPTNSSSKDSILVLQGRPLFTNRDKWQYCAKSNQLNGAVLPISCKGKSCTGEYGCDRVENGDTVYVEGSKEIYTVTLYDNQGLQYLPMVV